MVNEKSFGSVVFRKEGKQIFYLLLFRKAHDHYSELWDFPRGLIKENEDPEETASREVMEETGLGGLKFISGFKEKVNWFYKKNGVLVNKEATYFLAQSKNKDVKLSNEHDDFRWCSFEVALELITYNNTKKVLEKVDEFLKNSLISYY